MLGLDLSVVSLFRNDKRKTIVTSSAVEKSYGGARELKTKREIQI